MSVSFGILFSVQIHTRAYTHTFSILGASQPRLVKHTLQFSRLYMWHQIAWLILAVFSKWIHMAKWDEITALSCFLTSLKERIGKKPRKFAFFFPIIRIINSQIQRYYTRTSLETTWFPLIGITWHVKLRIPNHPN